MSHFLLKLLPEIAAFLPLGKSKPNGVGDLVLWIKDEKPN